jgi:phenylacetate-CoA ligase
LSPAAIEEVVRSIPQLGDEYQVIVSKKGDLDEITLKVELAPEARGKLDSIRTDLMHRLRVKTNLGYDLQIHEYGRLPRYDVKARRFMDLREK